MNADKSKDNSRRKATDQVEQAILTPVPPPTSERERRNRVWSAIRKPLHSPDGPRTHTVDQQSPAGAPLPPSGDPRPPSGDRRPPSGTAGQRPLSGALSKYSVLPSIGVSDLRERHPDSSTAQPSIRQPSSTSSRKPFTAVFRGSTSGSQQSAGERDVSPESSRNRHEPEADNRRRQTSVAPHRTSSATAPASAGGDEPRQEVVTDAARGRALSAGGGAGRCPASGEQQSNELFVLAVKLPDGRKVQGSVDPSLPLRQVMDLARNAASQDLSGYTLVTNSAPKRFFHLLDISVEEAGIENRTLLYLEPP